MSTTPPIDGLLLIDKPTGMTSHDVVHRVRKALKQKAVGHTGTLDPLATGLMILVLGEATKLSDYLVMTDKAYGLKVRLGVTTDSLDRTGAMVSTADVGHLTEDLIRQEALKLQGEFHWPVPLFSAAKVDGKKLYEYGRQGQDIVLPQKSMKFWDAEIQSIAPPLVELSIHCSKGSFIRTWAAQLGARLNVGGVIEELRRLKVGPYDVHAAITLGDLEASPVEALNSTLIPMAKALPGWKALMAGPKEARLVANGQVPRDMVNRLIFEQKQAFAAGEAVFVKVVTSEGHLLAIVAAEPGHGLKIRRVFRGFA